jgi:LCP family protein required for cell wall assembly
VNDFDDEREGHPSRPLPPRLDPRAGRGTRAPEAAPRRRTSGWAVTARVVGAVLSVLLLGGTGWGWYLGQVAEASVNRTDAIPTDGNTDTSGHGAAMNILLVADDSRDNLTASQRQALYAFDDGGSLNTDTMMLLHVPADGSRASFVSFYRDSYVQIPGHGWDKLNAAYADGYTSAPKSESEAERQAAGQQLLVQTISQLSGLQIDHFVSVDMLGFFNLSNVVGGVEVNVCKATYDPYTAARFAAGEQTLQGTRALLFVRQRHGLPGGDLDRVVRQQTFMAGVARKILSENVLLNPSKQRQLVSAIGKSLTVDQSLDIMQLAQQMQKITAGGVNFQTIPMVGFAKDPQGRDIDKLPSVATLHQWFANLESGPSATGTATATTTAAPKTVAPSKVKVQVFNGSGKAGLAATAGSALTSAGFVVTATGNADASTYTKTEIRYAEGDEGLAATLAAHFPGATTTVRSDATSGTVQIVLGSDFTAVGQPLKAAPTTASAGGAAAASSTPRTAADTACIN